MHPMDMPAELAELTPEDAIRFGAEALPMFGHIFFPRAFRSSSPPFHWEVGDVLYGPDRFVEILLARDFAKTTLLRTFMAQRVSYAISRTIMCIGASQPHAIMSLRWLKRHVQYNRKWIETFGLRQGDKWTDEHLEIHNTIDDCTITILAMGVTGQVRGFNPDDFRPDLIILDDILTDENVHTPAQRQKLSDLVNGAILNSLAPSSEAPFAKAVMLQTPFNQHDLAAEFAASEAWRTVVFGCFDENGESRWKDRYPTEELVKQKAIATKEGRYRVWMREKECKIVPGEDRIFDTSKVRYWDVLPDDLVIRVIAIDPATAETEKADYHATVCVGVRGKDVFVIAATRTKKTMPDKAATTFFEMLLNFGPITRAGVESIAYQRVLKWYLEQEMNSRRIWIPIEGVKDQRKKADRIMQHLPGLVAWGFLYIHPSMSAIIEEMDDYNPTLAEQQDDLLDALALAVMMVNPYRGVYEGEYTVVEDERALKTPLMIGGCP